ncbi:hypothetical protein [Pseudonocardia acaciae]|uniref:hypothetical protein n=1 Tax=Pseudonocardia acaciae TaxID=551276 RepID=UPI00048D0B3E|nr:hypothetical protein [Pseudonocardia acaciae]
MSTEVEILLRPIEEMNRIQVVIEVARAAGVELRHGPDIYEGRAYVGIIDDDVAIELFPDDRHDPDDDTGDMPFSKHPYTVEFRPLNRSVEKAQRSMERVYDRLKETGHFSLFATFDWQYPLRGDIV